MCPCVKVFASQERLKYMYDVMEKLFSLQLCAAPVKKPMEIRENLIGLMLRALLVMILVVHHPNKIEKVLKTTHCFLLG